MSPRPLDKATPRKRDRERISGWFGTFFRELFFFVSVTAQQVRLWARMPIQPRTFKIVYSIWFITGATVIVLLLVHQQRSKSFSPASANETETVEPLNTLTIPVREEPASFAAGKRMPGRREINYSQPNGTVNFVAQRDLVRIEDARVWWESDHDSGDTEDDHMIHRAMEEPLRRLIELVSACGATLKVQDSYRASGIHTTKSLHKEGRAVDLTCDDLGLEKLAKLTWASGFDWVYYEAPKRGGAHIHASVQP